MKGFKGTIKPIVLLGDQHVRVSVGVVDNFGVKILLGTLYINRFITRIFLLERRTFMIHSRPGIVLPSYYFNEASNAMINYDADSNEVQTTGKHAQMENWSILVRTPRKCVIPSLSKSPVLVTTSAAGLVTLNPHCNITKNQYRPTGKRVVEVAYQTSRFTSW